jgi:hypothetical protein
MAARITKLSTRPRRLRTAQAAQLRQLVLQFEELDAEAARRLIVAIDRETTAEAEWPFVMISPVQFDFVVQELMRQTARPRLASRLWAKLWLHIRRDTGEITISTPELAADLGVHPNNVSTVLGELVRMQALIRTKEGRHYRYFMNPLVGTHLAGAVRDKAQAEAPKLRLVEPA